MQILDLDADTRDGKTFLVFLALGNRNNLGDRNLGVGSEL